MKRTIEEVYNLIVEKRDNAEKEYKRNYEEEDYIKCNNLYYTAMAYQDVLSLIESSHLLEKKELSPIEALIMIVDECKKELILDEPRITKDLIEYECCGYPVKKIIDKITALEIIKNKKVNVNLLFICKSLDEYNWCVWQKERALTQEEYNLLKEVGL